MIRSSLPEIIEVRRTPTPLPQPQGLAVGPAHLYISFRDVPRIYTFDRDRSTLEAFCDIADTAWGMVAARDRVHAVIGSPLDDARSIHAFDEDGVEAAPPIACPDGTGSYLASDRTNLFLSQWYAQQIYRLHADGSFARIASTQRGVCGIASVGKALAVLNTEDEESEEYFITMVDPDGDRGQVDVARVPFRVRSLVWTGKTFLTSHRERGEVLEFSVPSSDTQVFLRFEG